MRCGKNKCKIKNPSSPSLDEDEGLLRVTTSFADYSANSVISGKIPKMLPSNGRKPDTAYYNSACCSQMRKTKTLHQLTPNVGSL